MVTVNPHLLIFFQYVITALEGDIEYEVQICAGTKILSNSQMIRLGNMSEKVTVYLPKKSCDDNRSVVQELSAGMIGGAICAVLFLLLAIIGFIVWR